VHPKSTPITCTRCIRLHIVPDYRVRGRRMERTSCMSTSVKAKLRPAYTPHTQHLKMKVYPGINNNSLPPQRWHACLRRQAHRRQNATKQRLTFLAATAEAAHGENIEEQ
jgi:hypothetical protein